MNEDQSKKPSVYIGFDADIAGSEIFKNVCYGLEEEGIPFYYFASEEKDAKVMAHEAAQGSRLSIGIGIGADNNIVLQHKKLDLGKPFFQKKIDYNFQAKVLGSNAARLVKGIPVKEIPLKDEFTKSSAPDIKFNKEIDLNFSKTKSDINKDEKKKYNLNDLAISSNKDKSSSEKDDLKDINDKYTKAKAEKQLKSSDRTENSEIEDNDKHAITKENVDLLTDLIMDAVKKLNN